MLPPAAVGCENGNALSGAGVPIETDGYSFHRYYPHRIQVLSASPYTVAGGCSNNSAGSFLVQLAKVVLRGPGAGAPGAFRFTFSEK